MFVATLPIVLGLSMVANALEVSEGLPIEKEVGKTCATALRADIECDIHVARFESFQYQIWPGDTEVADAICTDTCSDSLRSWNDTVAKECSEDLNKPNNFTVSFLQYHVGTMWQGVKETCVKDSKGHYCQEILEGFSQVEDDEERPYDELCHPCYRNVLIAMSTNRIWTGPDAADDGYWPSQLELVHKKCGDSRGSEESSKKKELSDTTQKTTGVSGMDMNPTTVSHETTGTAPVETVVTEAVSAEMNGVGILMVSQLGKLWVAVLMFMLGTIIL